MTDEAAANFHAYHVGSIRVSVISDGAIAMPVTDELVLNASAEDIRRALREADLPDERLTTTFAPIILQTGGQTVLIDAGLGPDFGAAKNVNAGMLVQNMRANGIEPDDIDLVIVSHFHADHINGLLSRGMPVFPKAQIAVPEREWTFWMDDAEQARAPEGRVAELFANSRRVFEPLRDRVRAYADGETIMPGLEAMATYGHSVGHMSFWLRSGSERIFIQSDLSNQAALFLPHPDWQSPLDQFPDQAVKVRREIYDRLAAERVPVQAFHHPFPGRFVIERDGHGYRRIALG
jgi:glyoxylase-like metal-dependent hydrolase (beta-lactamase superfamily II)